MTLKKYLTTHKITQAEFANLLGVKQQSVSRYINGLPPKREIAHKIIMITNGTVNYKDLWG